eukprot:Gb_23404 [translate_table: standard]
MASEQQTIKSVSHKTFLFKEIDSGFRVCSIGQLQREGNSTSGSELKAKAKPQHIATLWELKEVEDLTTGISTVEPTLLICCTSLFLPTCGSTNVARGEKDFHQSGPLPNILCGTGILVRCGVMSIDFESLLESVMLSGGQVDKLSSKTNTMENLLIEVKQENVIFYSSPKQLQSLMRLNHTILSTLFKCYVEAVLGVPLLPKITR